MTAEEALKIIKIAIADIEWNYPLDYAEAFEVAIEALEKQIPKKPLEQINEYDATMGNCPCCGDIVFDYPEDVKVCSNCGQALDWSEEE